jgi:hypothetical protein
VSTSTEDSRVGSSTAYVILCHRNPEQILRLVRAIRRLSPAAHVLVRHNQLGDFLDRTRTTEAGAELLVSKIRIRWGSWTMVAATLEAFRHARDLWAPDLYVLISGQDYPVRDLASWERGVRDSGVDAVTSPVPLLDGPFGYRPGKDRDRLRMRYTHRWFWLPELRVVSRLPVSLRRAIKSLWYRLLYPLQAFVVLNEMPDRGGWAIGVRRHSVPWSPSVKAYKGSQWIALSRRALAACSDGELADAWQRFFATTLVPDESFFQTLVENDPTMRIRHEFVSYVVWEAATGISPHPTLIERGMLSSAADSGSPFARKFDESINPELLDEIDAMLAAL